MKALLSAVVNSSIKTVKVKVFKAATYERRECQVKRCFIGLTIGILLLNKDKSVITCNALLIQKHDIGLLYIQQIFNKNNEKKGFRL